MLLDRLYGSSLTRWCWCGLQKRPMVYATQQQKHEELYSTGDKLRASSHRRCPRCRKNRMRGWMYGSSVRTSIALMPSVWNSWRRRSTATARRCA